MASYSIYTLYPMINRTAAAHIHNHCVLLILRVLLSKSLRSLLKKDNILYKNLQREISQFLWILQTAQTKSGPVSTVIAETDEFTLSATKKMWWSNFLRKKREDTKHRNIFIKPLIHLASRFSPHTCLLGVSSIMNQIAKTPRTLGEMKDLKKNKKERKQREMCVCSETIVKLFMCCVGIKGTQWRTTLSTLSQICKSLFSWFW